MRWVVFVSFRLWEIQRVGWIYTALRVRSSCLLGMLRTQFDKTSAVQFSPRRSSGQTHMRKTTKIQNKWINRQRIRRHGSNATQPCPAVIWISSRNEKLLSRAWLSSSRRRWRLLDGSVVIQDPGQWLHQVCTCIWKRCHVFLAGWWSVTCSLWLCCQTRH